MSLPCLFDCGGDAGPVQTTTTSSEVTVNTHTNVTGGPVNVTFGSDFLKPLAQTFLPIANSVETGLKATSNQAATIAQQVQQITDFSRKSQTQIVAQQQDLATLVKILGGVAVAGVVLQLYRAGRA